jgi:hypothetical protein
MTIELVNQDYATRWLAMICRRVSVINLQAMMRHAQFAATSPGLLKH